ncbi:MAG: hypothetical protein GY805_25970 [Chloroflexi bacterium]|nr:hypothetical protein [Chloroflexota bacterium]
MAFNKSTLHRVLTDALNPTEQRTLCLDLGLNYDSLDGQGTASKAHAILDAMEANGRLPELAAYVHKVRPKAPFNMPIFGDPEPHSAKQSASLHYIPHPRNRYFTGRETWLT